MPLPVLASRESGALSASRLARTRRAERVQQAAEQSEAATERALSEVEALQRRLGGTG
jgi:hypothetical protein